MSNKIIESQQTAINSRLDNILLSASAGTGKTYTMTKRIASLLRDGADISSFLVLAFGNDASKEMKDRIEKEIFTLSKEDGKFIPQLKKIKTASISTISSFALEISKTYFAISGASPKAKVLLGTDEDVLKATAMEKVFLDCYEQKDPDFLFLVEYFIQSRKDEQLKENVFKLYTAMRNMPDGEFETAFYKAYNEKALWQIYLNQIKESGKSLLENLLYKANEHEIYQKQYDQCESILKALAEAKDLYEVRDILSVKYVTKGGTSKKLEDKVKLINETFYQTVREVIKTWGNHHLKNLQNLETSEEFAGEYLEIAKKLFALTARFKEEYSALKQKKDFVDFSDTEHMLLAVLNDEKSLTELQEKYKHVFCDEYQDVSKIQEEILTRIAQKSNLFVVGDIKQSIYGFRACDQTVIKSRENNILKTNEGIVLRMNTNFRSHRDILEFSNCIFSVAMQNPEICDYQTSSMFEAMASFPDLGGVEIAVARKKEAPTTEKKTVYSVIEDKGRPREEINAEAEGKEIAKFIRKYLGKQFDFADGTRDVRLSDFAILTRKTSDKFALTVSRVLDNHNLPNYILASETQLKTHPKVLFVCDFLQAMANPRWDMPLYSTLVSPFFGIDDDTLFEIRIKNKKAYFHECFFALAEELATKFALPQLPFAKSTEIAREELANLCETLEISETPNISEIQAENSPQTNGDIFSIDFSKIPQGETLTKAEKAVCDFMTAHQKYRTLATISCGEMLETAIAENCVYEKVAIAHGEVELAFLKEFVKYVKSLQSPTLRHACEKLDNAQSTMKLQGGNTATNAIAIMTMHKSKGLEFPFTIIAGTGRKYNNQENKNPIHFHKDYGIAFGKRDIKTKIKQGTIEKTAMLSIIARDNCEEELRLLYVALTRPKYKLLITGTLDYDFRIEDNRVVSEDMPMINSREDFYRIKSHIDIILASLDKSKYTCNHTVTAIKEDEDSEEEIVKANPDLEECEILAKKLPTLENSNVTFPIIPTKFTATQRLESFNKTVKEEDLEVLEKYEVSKIIDFATSKSSTTPETAETTYSKTAIGTCYHKILEKVPFFLPTAEIATFISEMKANGEILDIEYDISKIHTLTHNPIFENTTPKREVPFVMQLPSEMFDLEKGDSVLCQGVIDCVFKNQNGNLIVVDYKATTIKNPQKLAEKYKKQLETYKLACEKILKTQVEACYIYSIFEEKLIEVNC